MSTVTVTPQSAHLSRDDYTIGWISALAVESVAAAEMLEEEYDPLPVASGDNNDYVLGRIGKHNVVMACINEAGGLAANIVARNIMTSFQNVRYILMVGIGGGIPSKKYPVRLGDIAVSEPSGGFPGVVQSDFGKWETDGFKITGSLNRPAEGLIRAIGAMKRLQLRNRSHIHDYVKHFKGSVAEPQSWKYQGRDSDPIYKDDLESRPNGVCGKCDADSELSPDPEVHYGIIASGNQVIKNAEQRDKLYGQLEACCVEMEAFGLMNNFPCLIVRGISDYADGRKNDKWQPYAALTAAAYAKELLLHLSSVEGTPRMPEQLMHIERKLNAIEEQMDVTRYVQEAQNRQRILDWISPDYHTAFHSNTLNKVEDIEKPGKWFINGSTFQEWRDNKTSSILWIKGDIGTGKTVIMSSVIQELLQSHPHVAYFYCSAGADQDKVLQDPHKVLRSLLRQLSSIKRDIIDDIRLAYERKDKKDLTLKEVKNLLTKLITELGSVIFIVDGLDELNDPKVLTDPFASISQMREGPNGIVKILVSGRDEGSTQSLRKWPCITIEPKDTEEEIESLIKKELEGIPAEEANEESKTIVFNRLKEKAGGRFRWVELSLKWIFYSRNAPDMIIPSLDTLPNTVADMYETLLEKINTDREENKTVAFRTIMWLLYAHRPLSIIQLKEAIFFRTGRNPESITEQHILDCCHHLVTLDQEADSFTFGHVSVTKFLQKAQKIHWDDFGDILANTIAADLCLSICGATLVYSGIHSQESSHLEQNPSSLTDYAQTYWPNHYAVVARERYKSGHDSNSLFSLKWNRGHWFTKWTRLLPEIISQADYIQRERLKDSLSYPSDSAFVCCVFDIPDIQEIDVQWRLNENGQTCFHCACQYNSTSAIKLLLNKGIDIGWRNDEGTPAYAFAARHTNCEIISLFIGDHKFKARVQDIMHAAARNEKNGTNIAALLIEHGAEDIRITSDVVRETSYTGKAGYDFMELLVEERFIPLAEDAVVSVAWWWKSGELMALFLDRRQNDVHVTEELVRAASQNKDGGLSILGILFDKRGKIMTSEDMLVTIAEICNESIMAGILERQDVLVTEKMMRAAAANSNGKSVLALLLNKKGQDIEITEDILEAAARRNTDSLELLLDRLGRKVPITERVVKSAARWGGKSALETLLNMRGEDVQITEEVVIEAASNFSSSQETMQLLLDQRGEDVQITEKVLKAAALNLTPKMMTSLVCPEREMEGVLDGLLRLPLIFGERGLEVIEPLLHKLGKDEIQSRLVQRREEIESVEKKYSEAVQKRIQLWLEIKRLSHSLTNELKTQPELDEVPKMEQDESIAAISGSRLAALSGKAMGPLIDQRGEELKKAIANWTWRLEIEKLHKRGNDFKLTGRAMIAFAKYFDKELMELVIDRLGENIQVLQEVVVAAAENRNNGLDIIKMLLSRHGRQINITPDVVKATAKNWKSGSRVMEFLIQRDDVQISEDVVVEMARSWGSMQNMALFEEYISKNNYAVSKVTISAKIMELALRIVTGKRLVELLIQKRRELEISEEGIAEIAKNFDKEAVELLLDQQPNAPLTEKVIQAAAGNWQGMELISLLIDRQRDFQVTEDVLQAAAGNKVNGKQILKLLLDRYGENIPIPSRVLKAAIMNESSGEEMAILLLKKARGGIAITEEDVIAVLENGKRGQAILMKLLEYSSGGIPVTTEIVKAAARNKRKSKELLVKILLSQQENGLQLAEDVVVVAAREFDEEVIKILLDQLRNIHITEELAQAVVSNEENGQEILMLLLNKQEKAFRCTESIVAILAKEFDEKILEQFLGRESKLRITEAILKSIVQNKKAKDIIQRPLSLHGEDVYITQDVFKAAAGTESGNKAMVSLLDQWSKSAEITEETIALIATNFDEKVMETLLHRRNDFCISEGVLKAASENSRFKEVMAVILDLRERDVQITEEVLIAINRNLYRNEVMLMVLEHRGKCIEFTENMVIIIASDFNSEVLRVLLHQRIDIQITERVLKAAITSYRAKEKLVAILDVHGDLQISAELLRAAAENPSDGEELLALLFGQKDVCLPDEVLEEAAGSWKISDDISALRGGHGRHRSVKSMEEIERNMRSGKRLVTSIIKHQKWTKITEDLLGRIAKDFDSEVIGMLLDCGEYEVPITGKVLKAAAENCTTTDVLAFLLDGRGSDIQITADIIRAAAMNSALGSTMFSVLEERDKIPYMELIKTLPTALYHIFTCPDCFSEIFRITWPGNWWKYESS